MAQVGLLNFSGGHVEKKKKEKKTLVGVAESGPHCIDAARFFSEIYSESVLMPPVSEVRPDAVLDVRTLPCPCNAMDTTFLR